jgi:small conductance mechanosensitive channel
MLLLSVAVVSAEPGEGGAPGAPDAEAPAEVSKREADLERLEALRVQREGALREIAALEEAARSAVGSDRRALEAELFQRRIEGLVTLERMAEVIQALEARGEDASEQRRALAALVPAAWPRVDAIHSALRSELLRLETERSEVVGDAEALARLAARIRRLEERLIRLFRASLDIVDLAEKVGAPSEEGRAWVAREVLARARLEASRLRLALEQVEDVEWMAAAADAAAVQTARGAAQHSVERSLAHLESILALMDRLELDGKAYRKLLIEATGEITVDTIDREVAADLVTRWLESARETLVQNGPRILFQTLVFLVIVTFFWGLARAVRKVVARAVEAPHLRFSLLLKRMVVSLSSGAIYLLGLLIAFSQLGVEVGPMLAGLGIAGFVLGFALQDTLGNFAAGVMILIYLPYDVDDMIDCAGGVFGKVSHMSLVSTTILTIDNKTLIVPNGKIWGDVITNVTAQSIRRVDLEFGIGYGDDIPHAEEVLWSVVQDHPKVLAHPEPVVKVHSLGDSSVNFIVRPWVSRDDYWDVHWDITREVKMRFDREGVSIPFPQRDVHLYTEAVAPSPAGASVGASGSIPVGASTPASRDEPEPPEEDV